MERSELRRQVLEGTAQISSRSEQVGEAAILGHAGHDDEVIDDRPLRAADRGDPEIDIGCETAVERHLTLASRRSGGHSAPVDKGQEQWLFELDRSVPEDKDDRRVGFVDLRPRRCEQSRIGPQLDILGHLFMFAPRDAARADLSHTRCRTAHKVTPRASPRHCFVLCPPRWGPLTLAFEWRSPEGDLSGGGRHDLR